MTAAEMIRELQDRFSQEELEQMNVRAFGEEVTDMHPRHVGFTVHYLELT